MLLVLPGLARAGSSAAEPPERSGPPPLGVRSAVLMDVRTGEVLWASEPTLSAPPASLTKLMTIDLALRALGDGELSLEEKVPVSKRAFALARNHELSRMFLEPRLPVTVEQLLYGLMVSSADDAATAMAERLAPTTRAFVAKMNAHARELGLLHTHFGDPAGLADSAHTDALDMARLARHLMTEHPEVLTYSRRKHFAYNDIRQPNYNGLLFRDVRVDGLKTGSLHGQYHLLATGEFRGVRLIALVMGAKSHKQREDSAEKLLDWGFAQFATPRAVAEREAPESLPLPEAVVPAHYTRKLSEPAPVWPSRGGR
jgi:D-alanyl-D-alanine carboxypeptidase (penicillin-binding protein 5/6)